MIPRAIPVPRAVLRAVLQAILDGVWRLDLLAISKIILMTNILDSANWLISGITIIFLRALARGLRLMLCFNQFVKISRALEVAESLLLFKLFLSRQIFLCHLHDDVGMNVIFAFYHSKCRVDHIVG